ncbi:hypothetical protein L914_12018 [Phytophthora nicotianae]|uniref:Uncharacterized protein n=2 Tax=Phytophthora nicotianae TaxID=4792 RepID=W2N373_PHYNI|nr:hypothetical protein L914_12018 [Phytophthora nicotianae]
MKQLQFHRFACSRQKRHDDTRCAGSPSSRADKHQRVGRRCGCTTSVSFRVLHLVQLLVVLSRRVSSPPTKIRLPRRGHFPENSSFRWISHTAKGSQSGHFGLRAQVHTRASQQRAASPMDYRQYQAQDNSMLSSARGMARLNGSNRAAWNAMDLQIGAQVPPSNARGAPEDGGALSARNVLLRQKLQERKRYDSADDAMKKAAARAANRYQKQAQPNQMPVQAPQQNQMPVQPQQQNQIQSPAQIGQSAFFNAMQGDSSKPKRNVQRNAPTAQYDPPGGAEQGRNVLIQRKLQSKQTFDSADYQMARARHTAENMEDTPMEDVSEAEPKQVEAVSSPCASTVANASRRQFASMSPSRAGKYGALENRKKPSRRDLLEKQKEDSAVTEKAQQAADYGKMSAAHVLIRRKLKERKRFDSADYAMEKQGQPTDVPAEVVAGPVVPGETTPKYGTLGASQASINHQVKHIKLSEDPSGRVASPAKTVVANAAQAALAARAARYAGLKGAGEAKPMANNSTPQAALDRYGLDKSVAPTGAAAARNVVLQHKLAERKMFDSADHFKKAA